MVWQVLVVAGGESAARALQEALWAEAPGTRVRRVDDPEAAARVVAGEPPALAVVRWPGAPETGLRAIAALRRSAKALPILAEVPGEHPLMALQAMEAGADDCVKQPVAPWEWRNRCRALIDTARQRHTIDHLLHRARRRLADAGGLEPLSRVLERVSTCRDAATGAHGRRTGHLARLAAEALGLPDDTCRLIGAGAALHDIGKVGIPDAVLRKPGRFVREDREVMEHHPLIGHEILASSPSEPMQMAAGIALGHHERFDGSGYPHGLAGNAIPVSARLTAVADVFDSLTARRRYKNDCSAAEGFDHLARGRGAHFDPECVDALLDRRPEVERFLQQHGPTEG